MVRPGSFFSRFLATALLLVVVWLVVQLMIVPVVAAYRATAQEIAQNQVLLERYRALAAQRPRYVLELEERREAGEADVGFLAGQNDMLAAASLQERVGAVIDAAGGELRSTQILPARVADEELAIRRAGLRLQFAAGIEGLEEILYRLETDEPYLFVDEINIREQRRRRRRSDPEIETLLDVSLEVYGYVRSGVADGTAAIRSPGRRPTLEGSA